MIRTYLSVVLLLCLAIQVAPLSLLHSHDDDHHHGQSEASHHEMASNDANGEYLIGIDHESSDEDCKVCELQQTLNNQSYTLVKKASVFNNGQYVSNDLTVVSSGDNYLLKSLSGRAPPRA